MKRRGKLLLAACAASAVLLSATVSTLPLTVADAAGASVYSNDFSTDITIVEKSTNLNVPISGGQETYLPSDRVWQGCPNVIVTERRIWAAWYSGGTTEPRDQNYCVISYSEDNGKTWVDPYMIIDPLGGKATVLPLFFLYEGELWIIYYNYTTPNNGTYAIKSSNYDAADISAVTWSEPAFMFSRMIHHRPTVLSDGSLIVGSQGSDKTQTNMYKSTDKGITWLSCGTATSDVNSIHKAKIVEKEDGRLWVLSQLELGAGGGMEQSFSSDGGKNWSKYEYNLAPPLISPGARFEITRLQSGNLALVSYATTNARTDLTVYLSEDDGNTWPYSVLLDDRTEVSYPDLAQDSEGKIYILWDMGRYEQKEMRMSVMTEEDIKKGAVPREAEKIIVSRLSDYRDIASVTNIQPAMQVALGTTSASIISGLPAALEVVDDLGGSRTLNGRWVSKGYKADVEGVYQLSFLPTSFGLLQDVHKLLQIKVTVGNPQTGEGPNGGDEQGGNKGCNSVLSGAAAICICAGAALVAGICKKK